MVSLILIDGEIAKASLKTLFKRTDVVCFVSLGLLLILCYLLFNLKAVSSFLNWKIFII